MNTEMVMEVFSEILYQEGYQQEIQNLEPCTRCGKDTQEYGVSGPEGAICWECDNGEGGGNE